MIIKVIPHLILKNAHLITGSPRIISYPNLLKIRQKANAFGKNYNFSAKLTFSAPTFF